MIGFMMFLHAFLSILLIVIILMQSGRGGGLTEGFASAESLFGAKTNEFMIKATTVFATIFLITSLGLAVLSAKKGKSLMSDQVIPSGEIPIAQAVETAAKEVSAQLDTMEEGAATPEVSVEVLPEDAPVVVTPGTE